MFYHFSHSTQSCDYSAFLVLKTCLFITWDVLHDSMWSTQQEGGWTVFQKPWHNEVEQCLSWHPDSSPFPLVENERSSGRIRQGRRRHFCGIHLKCWLHQETQNQTFAWSENVFPFCFKFGILPVTLEHSHCVKIQRNFWNCTALLYSFLPVA